MSNNLIPEFRFSGFKKDWEQARLGDVADIYDGTHQTPVYKDSGIMFLSVENIKTLKSNKFISEEDFKKEFKIKPVKGDVLMTRIGDVGTANVVIDEQDIAYYVSLALIKSNYLSPYFLKWNIHSPFMRNEFWRRTLHIAFPKKINKNEIANVLINFPSNEEQKKIGDFFKQLEKNIILHHQELAILKQTKQGFLQKMFPKEGDLAPEVRFPSFTGNWEECKLDDILKERKVKQKISEEAPLLAFAAGQGVIDRNDRKTNNRDFLTKDSINKKYLLTKLDDIVYNPANVKYGAIDRNKHGQGVISPIYVTFETEEIPSFIELLVKSENFKQRALQYEEGTVTKRQSVKPENFLSLNIVLPNSKDEQIKIGDFFEKLDNAISLKQQELNVLQQNTKAFLQKMYV